MVHARVLERRTYRRALAIGKQMPARHSFNHRAEFSAWASRTRRIRWLRWRNRSDATRRTRASQLPVFAVPPQEVFTRGASFEEARCILYRRECFRGAGLFSFQRFPHRAHCNHVPTIQKSDLRLLGSIDFGYDRSEVEALLGRLKAHCCG